MTPLPIKEKVFLHFNKLESHSPWNALGESLIKTDAVGLGKIFDNVISLQTEGQTDRQTDRLTERRTNRRTERWTSDIK